ncbi:MAG: ribonuclease E/G [Clostridiales bacterium]|jgi:ribonuclease G|nr:ribonuclease E/G [Clostridiales bacterium]
MKKIFVNRLENSHLTALTENGKLLELIRDSDDNASVAGNIYAGVVKKINTGFVFLDVGLARQAFLDTRDHRDRGLFCDGKLSVKQGDTLVVQILKDCTRDKGPAATSNITHSGRLVVLHKTLGERDKISVSRKIRDEAEAARLKALGEMHVPAGFSAIMRSAAENRSEDEIAQEIHTVSVKFAAHQQWRHIKAPAVLLAEPPIIKTLREFGGDDVHEIVVDDTSVFEVLQAEYGPRLRHYAEDEHIFAHFFLKTQIEKIRDRRVWLKSGGSIIIEQTEACVVIDVNSGKLTAKRGNAALKVNLEAAKEIAYQLRLRNLSGIIIVDFIAINSPEDTHSLTEFLRAQLAKDRIPAVVVGMTALGLMEITRKRIRPPF